MILQIAERMEEKGWEELSNLYVISMETDEGAVRHGRERGEVNVII